MNTTVTYPPDKPVEVFTRGQQVILQIDAYTMDDHFIPKNTPVTIYTSESYKIDRRASTAAGNPKPNEVEYHFTVLVTVDRVQVRATAFDDINDVQLKPRPNGGRILKRLTPGSDNAFLRNAVQYRVRDSRMGTFSPKETLNAGQEIKIMGGPMSMAGNPETGRDYKYAPVTWTKEAVVARGRPLVHSAFRAA
ncbi:hypothetical protein BDZ89DRAFT_1074234 [Hymenopellis radicata]|nr:hypothetical protein BDZ89DRAFT_1074234 [Hymenopellis radicata]